MRELGLCVTSAGSIKVVKRHVRRLNLDTSHFTGQRRWSDAQLRRAVADAVSWDELIAALGQASGQEAGRVVVRSHARRLGLDLTKIDCPGQAADHAIPALQPQIRHLRSAAAAIAAMWFGLCGCTTSIPLEPAVYDLLVGMPGGIKRIQIKTTTYSKNGWEVKVGRRPYSVRNLGPLIPYDPDSLDYFFILDGDLTMYLIPSDAVAGRVGILLRNYTDYVVGSAGSVMQIPVVTGLG
jgi:hypothetical protein